MTGHDKMGSVYFYHMTRAPLDVTLRLLLQKSLQAGWTVLVRGPDAQRLEWLDRKLWLGPDEEFLPHGLAGGPHDARQPVLLTTGPGNPNGAQALISVDGAPVTPQEVRASQRVMVVFDGADPQAVEAARGQWKTLTAAGCPAQYWAQEDSGWKMKSQAQPAGK